MNSVLLMNPDDGTFDIKAVAQILELDEAFRDVRFDEPGGAAIEAEYVELEGRTIVRLSGSRKSISFSGTSDSAFRAALAVQKHFDRPLRMVDSDYSFDLMVEGLSNIEELRAAIEREQSS